ncbi:TBC1 domain family member 20 [Daktulosphaira vitifoliae]|uniref:TBC1 domain family member 20 n=1 Tax=Daktulosphaira vitifoliae TaxID=58002 RepID=UPI0021AAC7CC|nr:TBC1 domain family member 20 [Daktulosphaira vitifoliae]XP_050529316.1 TBC1 domain family member 20 [Daktulosphaira vitifoliae]
MTGYDSDNSSDSSYSNIDFYEVQNVVPDQYKSKVDKCNEILLHDKKDIDELRNLATSEGGLVISLVRSEAWPLFLNLPKKNKQLLDEEIITNHPEYNQVVMDVRRCLKRFPPGISYERIGVLQNQLIAIILSVIAEHPELKYYQGYHDVAVTFLIEVGQEKAYSIMEYLSLNHLRQFLMPTMEETSYMLWNVFPLISKLNPELEYFLTKSGIGTIFALPWLLSWFSHSLSQHKKVVRLFDYFLASPKEIILYVIAQLINERSEDILSADCDMASVHSVISKIPEDIDFEKILSQATNMLYEYPLSKIKYEVDIKVQQEADFLAGLNENYTMRKHLKYMKSIGHGPPFANAYNFVPIWRIPRMRFGFLFFGFSLAAGLWAIMRTSSN